MLKCPHCQNQLAADDVNVVTDLAKCTSCQQIFKASEALDDAPASANFSVDNPPKGAWIRRNEKAIVLGASTRSNMAFFLIPFMLVWSGFSLGGIYGTQIFSGEFNVLISLFGIPFLLGTILFGWKALMTVMGKVEIHADRTGGRIFTGIGPFGFTKKFRWAEIDQVSEYTTASNKSTSTSISLEGQKRIRFGSGLNSSRRYYVFKSMEDLHRSMSNKNY